MTKHHFLPRQKAATTACIRSSGVVKEQVFFRLLFVVFVVGIDVFVAVVVIVIVAVVDVML